MGGKWTGIGAASGAALGSVIPGLGTALGGALGAIGGGLADVFGGQSDEDLRKELEEQNKQRQRDQYLKSLADQKLEQSNPASAVRPTAGLPAAASSVASGLPGVTDPEYYQKLAQQKYRSAMGG